MALAAKPLLCVHHHALNWVVRFVNEWGYKQYFSSKSPFGKEGSHPEVLRFGLDIFVPLEPQNPYPFLRFILAAKSTHFKDFSWNKAPCIFYTIFGCEKFTKYVRNPRCLQTPSETRAWFQHNHTTGNSHEIQHPSVKFHNVIMLIKLCQSSLCSRMIH